MSGRGRHGESGCPATRDVRDRPLCRSVRVAGRAHPWVAAAALCTPHPGPRGTAQLSSVCFIPLRPFVLETVVYLDFCRRRPLTCGPAAGISRSLGRASVLAGCPRPAEVGAQAPLPGPPSFPSRNRPLLLSRPVTPGQPLLPAPGRGAGPGPSALLIPLHSASHRRRPRGLWRRLWEGPESLRRSFPRGSSHGGAGLGSGVEGCPRV